jgi:cytochrome P450
MSNTADKNLEAAFATVTSNYRGLTENPYALYSELRHASPVLAEDIMARLGVPSIASRDPNRPVFSLFKHADCMAVLRDAEQFTSGFIAEGLGAFLDGLILTGMDGEEHKNARALLTPVFAASAIRKWRIERIDPVMRKEFIEPLVPLSKANLEKIAVDFPVRIIYSLIGFPEDDPNMMKQFAAWALTILAGPQVDPKKAEQAKHAALAAAKSLYDAIRPIVEKRRADGAQGDDLISSLLRAEHEGRQLDDHEVTTFVRSLLPAAAETTTRTFGTLMTLLLERPALLDRLRQDRKLILKAIDEAVRLEPVATFKVRQAARDTEIRGVAVPEGAMVSCIVSSANRDEEVFEDSNSFNIDRPRKPAFGFGFGPHMCIGMSVAITEIDSAVNAILDLLPNIRLDPDAPPPKITGLQLRGPSAIHVVWDASS